jgi:hypothetical protein
MKSKTLGKYSVQRMVDETKLKFVRPNLSVRRTSLLVHFNTMYALERGWLVRLLLSCGLL